MKILKVSKEGLKNIILATTLWLIFFVLSIGVLNCPIRFALICFPIGILFFISCADDGEWHGFE